jgi:hypothetical protein
LPGWSDQQLADGTVVITAPTPRTIHRGLMMPKRKRTRSQTRAQRIQAERALNDAHVAERNKPPPF